MRFGSICSGIEAASVAWGDMWEAAWFSEIEPTPCKLLAHHYPEVPNHGDMTKLPAAIAAGVVEAPDLLVGGTPCQAFSVAGLRKSLDDARGNLSLTFVEIANEIDKSRDADGKPPAIIFWENVVGALNTPDNFFGCFLAALAGEDEAFDAAGGKWSNAGCVFGPQRAVAWRVLDAQHFGVPQRRRRLFVVSCPLERANPTQILFEFEGLRRDSVPSRPSGQDPTSALTSSTGGVDENDAVGGLIQPYDMLAFGHYGTGHTASTMKARDYKDATDLVVEVPAKAYRVAGDGAAYETEEQTAPLTTGTDRNAQVVVHKATGVGASLPPHLSYSTKTSNTTSRQAGKFYEEYIPSLDVKSEPPAIVTFVKGTNPHSKDEAPTFKQTETAACLNGWDERHDPPKHLVTGQTKVRRLMPIEGERLMGFPDGYTDVAGASDSARYKALGNSWAVPVIRWIGRRIQGAIQ